MRALLARENGRYGRRDRGLQDVPFVGITVKATQYNVSGMTVKETRHYCRLRWAEFFFRKLITLGYISLVRHKKTILPKF